MGEMIKIMLVDDDDVINLVHEDTLEIVGFAEEVVVKCSVDDAMNYLKNPEGKQVDLVFLDINMPLKTGWDFLDEFKQMEFSGKRPMVMMLTSSIDPNDRKRAEDNPLVEEFIIKPFSIKNLQEIYNQYFERK